MSKTVTHDTMILEDIEVGMGVEHSNYGFGVVREVRNTFNHEPKVLVSFGNKNRLIGERNFKVSVEPVE